MTSKIIASVMGRHNMSWTTKQDSPLQEIAKLREDCDSGGANKSAYMQEVKKLFHCELVHPVSALDQSQEKLAELLLSLSIFLWRHQAIILDHKAVKPCIDPVKIKRSFQQGVKK